MNKKVIVIADDDEQYLDNLSNYIMEKEPKIDLITFTRRDKLAHYLKCAEKPDILLFGASFLSEPLSELPEDVTKILLADSTGKASGYDCIKKYQKAETIFNEMMLRYAEHTDSIEVIKGSRTTRVLCFYSPAGGSGKTTLALAVAAVCVQMGKKVLYLNLEEIDSVNDIFNQTEIGLSELFLILKTKGMDLGVKIAAAAERETDSGIYYLTGIDSVLEYEEIEGKDVRELIGAVCRLAEFDVLVVDCSSGFSDRERAAMEEADHILVPALSDETSVSKLCKWLHEASVHDEYKEIFSKMQLWINKTNVNGTVIELQERGILNQIPCGAVIALSPVLMHKRDILRSGGLLGSIFEPILAAVI